MNKNASKYLLIFLNLIYFIFPNHLHNFIFHFHNHHNHCHHNHHHNFLNLIFIHINLKNQSHPKI